MIYIKNNNDDKLRKEIHLNLRSHNREKCEWLKKNISEDPSDDKIKYINFIAYDDDILIGGAVGFVQYEWYFLDLLWLNEKYRNQKIGKMLIDNIEEYAKNNNLIGVRMETWNFQARGFYEKMGYKVFAQIENCPPGTIDYYLKKEIK